MKIGILGAGSWGGALALAAADAGHDVTLWSYNNIFDDFHGRDIPANVRPTDQLADLRDMDLWMGVVPAAFFRETLVTAAPHYGHQPLLICTKGIEPGTHRFMAEIVADVLPDCRDVAVLSGPQFAAEVARRVPTSST
ncbi:glycerol-3-phosphate dehydrogenase, partial [bacterium]|nr:glycerol-3-phosphate dehydrogenase [bacterium]